MMRTSNGCMVFITTLLLVMCCCYHNSFTNAESETLVLRSNDDHLYDSSQQQQQQQQEAEDIDLSMLELWQSDVADEIESMNQENIVSLIDEEEQTQQQWEPKSTDIAWSVLDEKYNSDKQTNKKQGGISTTEASITDGTTTADAKKSNQQDKKSDEKQQQQQQHQHQHKEGSLYPIKYNLADYTDGKQALLAYANFHKAAIERCKRDADVKFLVYEQNQKSLGMGNYLMSLIHLAAAAMASGRVLLWKFEPQNFDLSELFSPIPIQYSLDSVRSKCPDAFKSEKRMKQQDSKGYNEFEKEYLCKQGLDKLTERVITIDHLYSWMLGAYQCDQHGVLLRRVFPDGVPRAMARWLFPTGPLVQKKVDKMTKEWTIGQQNILTIGLQIRVPSRLDLAQGGDAFHSGVDPKAIAHCSQYYAKSIAKQLKSVAASPDVKVQFFVTASRASVRTLAAEALQPAHVILPHDRPVHSASGKVDALKNARTALSEMLVLSKCDAIVVVSNSAYGLMSTHFKENGDNVVLVEGRDAAECQKVTFEFTNTTHISPLPKELIHPQEKKPDQDNKKKTDKDAANTADKNNNNNNNNNKDGNGNNDNSKSQSSSNSQSVSKSSSATAPSVVSSSSSSLSSSSSSSSI